MANKNVVVDGVLYELSLADWKLQQQILSRAKVIRGYKTPQVESFVASKKLTDDVVTRLVGYTNVVYYNYETNVWNVNDYKGYETKFQDADTKKMLSFKSAMEREPQFCAQYEIVAAVTLRVGRIPGWGRTVSNPEFKDDGTAVVGNIIVKKHATGNYELLSKSWIGVDDFCISQVAVNSGARWFAFYGAGNHGFRVALIVSHER